MNTLEARLFGRLIEDFAEAHWLDTMNGTASSFSELELHTMMATEEGVPQQKVNLARKAAIIAVSSNTWRPEEV